RISAATLGKLHARLLPRRQRPHVVRLPGERQGRVFLSGEVSGGQAVGWGERKRKPPPARVAECASRRVPLRSTNPTGPACADIATSLREKIMRDDFHSLDRRHFLTAGALTLGALTSLPRIASAQQALAAEPGAKPLSRVLAEFIASFDL